jgi:curved DNA-binding protein CbpA
MTSEPNRPALSPVDVRATPYQRLGFERPVFGLDDKVLERAWLERSRKVHPDRFAARPDAERRLAAEHTIALNEAYRALKDPYDRAVWLVRHAGVETADLDQAQLVSLMEMREEAEEGPTHRAAIVVRAKARFRAVEHAVRIRLLNADADSAGYAQPSEPLRQAARGLAEMKTLARLVDDLGGAPDGKLISTLDGR